MKKIITYGTFDLFHVGHVRLLKRLKDLGDYLIVGVSSDEFNLQKGKSSYFSYEERAEIVRSCRYVDEVIKEDCWEQKENDIRNLGVDVFAIGDDWIDKFNHLRNYCEVMYLSRTQDISTTKIKKTISKMSNDHLDEIEEGIEDLISIVRAIKNEKN